MLVCLVKLGEKKEKNILPCQVLLDHVSGKCAPRGLRQRLEQVPIRIFRPNHEHQQVLVPTTKARSQQEKNCCHLLPQQYSGTTVTLLNGTLKKA